MRISIILALSLLVIQLLIDFYLYLAVRRRAPRRAPLEIAQGVFFLIYALTIFFIPARTDAYSNGLNVLMWMVFIYFMVYGAKIVFILFDIIGRIFRNKWFSRVGMGAAFLLVIAMLWGAFINRKHLQVKEIEIPVENLPESFNGYRIAQISDLHLGTFGSDTAFVARLVDSINSLRPDLIVFTGDLVNQRADEATPFIAPLSRLDAADGVFSILGNHDYGDYVVWASETDKEENLEQLMDNQLAMGWELLTNSAETIHRAAGDSIVIVGVENWGDPPFTRYGDIDVAYPTSGDSATKILLTHNPRHWTDLVAPNDTMAYALTLSGHTHAMQMEINNLSPAQLRYPDCWGGLYPAADGKRFLYVNIGAGTVGFPMRIGATPEITLITLKRK